MKHLPFTLPVDPSDEELDAERWRSRTGEPLPRRRHEAQLCPSALRAAASWPVPEQRLLVGACLDHEPRRPPTWPSSSAVHGAAGTHVERPTPTHERRIRDYLGYSTFDDEARRQLDRWLASQVTKGLLADELVAGAESFLRLKRIVLPARYAIERMVGAVSARLEEERYRTIADRLGREQQMAFPRSPLEQAVRPAGGDLGMRLLWDKRGGKCTEILEPDKSRFGVGVRVP